MLDRLPVLPLSFLQACSGAGPGWHGSGWIAVSAVLSEGSAKVCRALLLPSERYSYRIFAKISDFSAKRKIFPQIHRNTLENSQLHQTRRPARQTETHPILETFLFLFTTRRFGSVGAPEGSEKEPDHIFPQIRKQLCFWRKIMEPTGFFRKKVCFWRKIMDDNRIFPQNL